ncbi:GAP1-N2 domain-containing protein [Tessaracoccus flavescens]|uniref:GTPase-associated protein 1 N-terminal domain-containing protein n=1 Tax=Tessaracoccus flavescens TaxID=399497 RepID=A0A1Q2CXM4_9ACTN|nr:hypothetical protein [Tessaracoccus flavescens]AQP50875.1 hypothetical protein BW733_08565 [Tessaracoccus flavescens]
MQQLIYGSADQISGRQVGGWGVLHGTPDLTAETQRRLLALTSVALPSTLPQFPSAEQLAQRTVRFRLDPSEAEYAACRSVEAGTDHTGRPGNVVSHCALIPADDRLRPVDWFFSPGWAMPYGPRQIAETRLPAELPAPSGWAETAAWLRADPARTARIRWIVDVAATVLLDAQRLVLKSPTAEEAARWASVLSWLVDAQVADLIRIRIGEDSRSTVEQLAVAPVIVGVTVDLDPATLRGLPVIDTSWQLDAEEAMSTGRWHLPTGQSFKASTFTGLAGDLVYADPDVAQAVFTKRDELIARFVREGNTLEVAHETLFLQAAWLTTPGAQELARVEPIRQLLAGLDDGVRRWDEFAGLASEVGEPVPSETPADQVDVYSMPTQPIDPWQVDDEPTGIEAALIGAARLGAAGVDVEALIAEGRIADRIDDHPEELRASLRDVAAALHPLEDTLHGEDR